jgi:hypothetical protein
MKIFLLKGFFNNHHLPVGRCIYKTRIRFKIPDRISEKEKNKNVEKNGC